MKDDLPKQEVDSRLSDSLVLEAIGIATNERGFIDSLPFDESVPRKLILSSITETAAHDDDLRDVLLRDDELSNDLIVRATRIAIKRRQKLGFFVRPIWRKIPKFFTRAIPLLYFLDREIVWLSFLDARVY